MVRGLLADIENGLIRVATRGFSRVIILWLLSHGPLSGYGIIREMRRLIERDFTSGVVYPILYDLESRGLIVGEWIRRGRRMIKYYSLTDEGSRVLKSIRDLFHGTAGAVLLDFMGR